MRVVAIALSSLIAVALPRSAGADEIDACANAYESAQRLHQKNDPKALSEAQTCARDVCPELLRKECGVWAKEWAPPPPPPKSQSQSGSTRELPPPPPAEDRPVPTLVYVLGGGGLVALGIAGGVALHGMSLRSDLEAAGCEPTCPSSRVDKARMAFLVADLFGIVGVGALGGALAIYLMRPGPKASAGSQIVVTPLVGMGGAALRGTF